MANRTSGAFTGTGSSADVAFQVGHLSLWGTFVATISLQSSFDDGVTWHDVDAASFTAVADKIVEGGAWNTRWRLNVSGFTSGTINYFLGSLRED